MFWDQRAKEVLEIFPILLESDVQQGKGISRVIRCRHTGKDQCARFRPLLATLETWEGSERGLTGLTYRRRGETVLLLNKQILRAVGIIAASCYLHDTRSSDSCWESVITLADQLETFGLSNHEIEHFILTTMLIARLPPNPLLRVVYHHLRVHPLSPSRLVRLNSHLVTLLAKCLSNQE
jgi:hypothetical protein